MSEQRHRTPQEDRRIGGSWSPSLYADMVGYSRLIGLDDQGRSSGCGALRKNLIDPAIEEHGGRIVQTGGDFAAHRVRQHRWGGALCREGAASRFRSMTAISRLIEPSASASGSTLATRLPMGLTCTATR